MREEEARKQAVEAEGAVESAGSGLSERESKREEELRKKPVGVASLLGEVILVDEEEGFLLFKRFGNAWAGGDEVISSINKAGETASLAITGERRGRFYAADVNSGNPKTGDMIYARRLWGEESGDKKAESRENEVEDG